MTTRMNIEFLRRVKSASDIFEEMLGDIDYPDDSETGQLYPFKVRVGCVQKRPPRHEFFEYMLGYGRNHVGQILSGERFENKRLTFVFPERWMGIAEQQSFMHVLAKHPDAKKLEQVDIITSSPIMISSFHREQIRILTWEDDDKYCGEI